MEEQTARCMAVVQAGIIPGTPMDEFSQTYAVTSEEWYANDGADQARLLTELAGKATAWATYLMLQPDRVNWVRTNWVWF